MSLNKCVVDEEEVADVGRHGDVARGRAVRGLGRDLRQRARAGVFEAHDLAVLLDALGADIDDVFVRVVPFL